MELKHLNRESFQPSLHRLKRFAAQPVPGLAVLRINHTPLLQELYAWLQQQFPKLPVHSIAINRQVQTSQDILKQVVSHDQGLVFLENFHQVLYDHDPSTWTAFNVNRDQLFKKPIKLVLLLPEWPDVTPTAMRRIADLWDFVILQLDFTLSPTTLPHTTNPQLTPLPPYITANMEILTRDQAEREQAWQQTKSSLPAVALLEPTLLQINDFDTWASTVADLPDCLEEVRQLFEEYLKAHAAHPWPPEANYRIGVFWVKRHDRPHHIAQAITFLEKGFQEGTLWPYGEYFWLGEAHYQLKKYTQALHFYEKAVAALPPLPNSMPVHGTLFITYYNSCIQAACQMGNIKRARHWHHQLATLPYAPLHNEQAEFSLEGPWLIEHAQAFIHFYAHEYAKAEEIWRNIFFKLGTEVDLLWLLAILHNMALAQHMQERAPMPLYGQFEPQELVGYVASEFKHAINVDRAICKQVHTNSQLMAP